MTRRALVRIGVVVLAIVSLVAVAGVAAADGDRQSPASDPLAEAHVGECAEESPDDHADPAGGTDDVIGWVDGYWYDEPIEIDDPTALSREELEAFTARTAARVETIRCQPFKELPPVELVTRDEFGSHLETHFAEYFTQDREQFVDAQLAAMLVAGQDTEAARLLEEHRTGFAAAFYDPEEEFIGMIGETAEDTEINEVTFAHELNHALQDNYYNLSAYNRGETTDGLNANLSVVEGESRFVDYEYEQRCGPDGWVGDCIGLGRGANAPEPVSWQLSLWDFQPYTDGFTLVESQYEEEGWDGVDQLFDQPPTSTLQTIYPEFYGEVQPEEVSVPDRSDGEWERITFPDEFDGDRVGQAGLSAMVMGIGYETNFSPAIIDQFDMITAHPRDNVEYDHPETDGWRGDGLYAYKNGDELGAVWSLAWTDGDEAQRFADAYASLAEIRGANQHDTYENVWTFADVDGWDMAIAVEQRDDRLLIVTAPTVDDLPAVHDGIDLGQAGDDQADGDETDDGEDSDADQESETDDGTGADDTDDGTGADDTDGDEGSETEGGDETTDEESPDDEEADDDGAGFGVLGAALAIAATALLARRIDTE